MNIFPRPTSLLAASMVVLGLASLAGCSGVISHGGDGGDGGGGSGGATASTSIPGTGGAGGDVGCDPGACPTQAIAMSHADFAAAMGESPNGGLLTDTQYLLYGGGAGTPTCSAPRGDDSACGGWVAQITLPTSYLTPGTYPFADFEIDMYVTESISEGNGMCAGMAGGGFPEGEIIIHAVTNTVVSFSVQGVDEVFDFPVNGDFEAERCLLGD